MLKALLVSALSTGIAVSAPGAASAHTLAGQGIAGHPVARHAGHTTVSWTVQAHEDGSGRITRSVRHSARGFVHRTVVPVREGILPWECDRNGNRICGVGGNRSTRTVTVVVARRPGMARSVAVTYSTTGATSVRIATDEDAEGEVV